MLRSLVGSELCLWDRIRVSNLSLSVFFEPPSFILLSTGTGTPDVSYASENMNTLVGGLFSASYSYKRKYLFTGSVRQDTSSRFASEIANDYFPNASVGWVIDKESFFNSSLINNLKLRASYGEIGNQTLPASNPDVNISTLNDNIPDRDLKIFMRYSHYELSYWI